MNNTVLEKEHIRKYKIIRIVKISIFSTEILVMVKHIQMLQLFWYFLIISYQRVRLSAHN